MSTWVIDTNILEHLLFTAPAVVNDKDEETTPAGPNHDGHITRFLKHLIVAGATLAVDDKERMRGEYKHRLEQRIKEAPESTSRQLLMWAIESSPKAKQKVNHGGGLMTCISETAIHAEDSDKLIVYVAAVARCPLATNNERHINNVKQGLKKCAKKHAAKGLEIYNSREALALVTPPASSSTSPAA